VTAVDESGQKKIVVTNLAPYETMMTQAADPKALPELLILRERMRAWRFYDHFRTDVDAPVRQARVATRTPVLSADGSDLPPALQTIRENGNDKGLHEAISDAFPGGSIEIEDIGGKLELRMLQHGLLRSLSAAELSEGTLRYFLLLAALFTPRPPGLMVLNEPEASLHPDLLPPLARLIAGAATRCQIIVVTHAVPLADMLRKAGGLNHDLSKSFGETQVANLASPAWAWPSR
jgi:predicted ATPase